MSREACPKHLQTVPYVPSPMRLTFLNWSTLLQFASRLERCTVTGRSVNVSSTCISFVELIVCETFRVPSKRVTTKVGWTRIDQDSWFKRDHDVCLLINKLCIRRVHFPWSMLGPTVLHSITAYRRSAVRKAVLRETFSSTGWTLQTVYRTVFRVFFVRNWTFGIQWNSSIRFAGKSKFFWTWKKFMKWNFAQSK